MRTRAAVATCASAPSEGVTEEFGMTRPANPAKDEGELFLYVVDLAERCARGRAYARRVAERYANGRIGNGLMNAHRLSRETINEGFDPKYSGKSIRSVAVC